MPKQLALLEEQQVPVFERGYDGLSIRESRRARRLILHIVPPHRLELVVPRGTRPREVEAFVRQHADWIERARREIDLRYTADRNRHPRSIELKAIGSCFDVSYRYTLQEPAGYHTSHGRVEVCSNHVGLPDANDILRRWLLAQGRRYLKPWLRAEAQALGTQPRKLQVRLQRTRWGSCSATGTISMNASLLLLDARLVRYLMIHELSHMHALDHSAAFWSQVRRFEPDYERLDRELANAWTEMPYWVLAD